MSTTSLMPSSESDIRDLLISETEGLHISGGQSRLRATEEKVMLSVFDTDDAPSTSIE